MDLKDLCIYELKHFYFEKYDFLRKLETAQGDDYFYYLGCLKMILEIIEIKEERLKELEGDL